MFSIGSGPVHTFIAVALAAAATGLPQPARYGPIQRLYVTGPPDAPPLVLLHELPGLRDGDSLFACNSTRASHAILDVFRRGIDISESETANAMKDHPAESNRRFDALVAFLNGRLRPGPPPAAGGCA